jgi:hypothetical protein
MSTAPRMCPSVGGRSDRDGHTPVYPHPARPARGCQPSAIGRWRPSPGRPGARVDPAGTRPSDRRPAGERSGAELRHRLPAPRIEGLRTATLPAWARRRDPLRPRWPWRSLGRRCRRCWLTSATGRVVGPEAGGWGVGAPGELWERRGERNAHDRGVHASVPARRRARRLARRLARRRGEPPGEGAGAHPQSSTPRCSTARSARPERCGRVGSGGGARQRPVACGFRW